MRPTRLAGLLVLALFACGALAAPGAYAVEEEEANNPRILLLQKGAKELQVVAKGGAVVTESLSGKTVTSATTEAVAKNCEAVAGTEEKDISLCKDVPLTLTGVKQGAVACRSENAKGEKDPIEVILALVDLRIGAGTSTTKVLQPLGIGKVLGTALETELKVACSVIKIQMKGSLGCIVPFGLKNIPVTEEIEVTCKMKTGDQELGGTCTIGCESLETDPFMINFGSGFEDAGKSFTMKGSANKDIFIDD